MSTHLNIAAIAKRTGVAPDTLRKWEQRYGVLQPERTTGGQRRYSQQDVARVEWLRDRLAEGWRIGEAARVLTESDVTAPEDAQALGVMLVEATLSSETATVGALLDQAFAVMPVEQAMEDVVSPFLRWIGDAWHAGELSIATEHAVTSRIRARLEQLMVDERSGVRGTAVLACAPDEQHDLGLLMIAILMRADGWAVEYLGASTPVADAVAHARSIGARLVCFSCTRDDTFRELHRQLAAIDGDLPRILVGGPGVDPSANGVPASPLLADSLSAAVTEIRDRVG